MESPHGLGIKIGASPSDCPDPRRVTVVNSRRRGKAARRIHDAAPPADHPPRKKKRAPEPKEPERANFHDESSRTRLKIYFKIGTRMRRRRVTPAITPNIR